MRGESNKHCLLTFSLALKLPENGVVFKTGSVKKGEKRHCGIIPDLNYTNVNGV